MKLLLLLFSFLFTNAFAQQVVVANLKENIVYCGVQNPLSALVEGYPCASVVLTTGNGKITKESCGYFIYQPKEPGNTIIKVWVKNGKRLKKAGEIPYRAKRLPLPVAFIGIMNGGDISLESLIRMGGVRVVFLNFDIDAYFQIIDYSIIASRNKEILFYNINIGAQYNDATLNHLKNLQINDQLLVSNITCIGPDGKKQILQPLEFTVTE